MTIKSLMNKVLLKTTGNMLIGAHKSTINVYDILRARLSGVIKDKYNITPYQALVYYSSVAPAAKSISMLSSEFSTINPYVYDIIAQKFVEKDSDIERLLSRPNPSQTKSKFMKELAVYYLATGNAYVMAIGLANKPPVELQILQPEYVSPHKADKDAYADTYTYQSADNSVVFTRIEEKGRFRYIDASGGRELFHLRTFNPNGDRLTGMSRLDQVYYEVEQHLNASIHNLSTLKKGARLSGLLTSEQELGEEQRPRLKEQLNSQYAGADNAGQIMLLDGAKFDFKEMSTSLKDMDFLNLKKEVTNSIFVAFDIPLPLANADTMTLNNYSEAKLTLYDNGVLPLTTTLYEELTHCLFPRYKMDLEKMKLWYDDGEITALEPRRADNVKKKKESGVLTINEIRAAMGYAALEEGDVLYQPSTLIPVGSTPIQLSQLQPPAKSKTTREKFFKILQAEVDHKGVRVYTDEEIESIAASRGL